MKRAVVLAGGKGRRLRPYTIVLPKPLMPIGEYPILEVVIRQLVKNGFEHISLAVNHQASLIRTFFGDGSKWNVYIDYFQEDEILGTMGPLKNIPNLPENFLVMNGDILTDINFDEAYRIHENNNSLFTIFCKNREQKIDYGVLQCDSNNYLVGFKEKPVYNYLVSMGIYMLNKKVLEYIPESFFGFDNLMNELLKKEKKVKTSVHNGYWLDIGRPDDYVKAIEDFNKMREKLF